MLRKTLAVLAFSVAGVAHANGTAPPSETPPSESASDTAPVPVAEPPPEAPTDAQTPPPASGNGAAETPAPMGNGSDTSAARAKAKANAMGLGMKGTMTGSDVTAEIQNWPAESRTAAQDMMTKYGQPDEVTETKLVWMNKGSFVRIAVLRDAFDHQFPMPHKDVLMQVVNYKVPPDKFDDLALFDGSISADRTDGTLSIRCDNEALNMATLNLADDLIKGKKNVKQARDALDKAAMQIQAGTPPVLAQQLQFSAQQTATADPDKPSASAMGR